MTLYVSVLIFDFLLYLTDLTLTLPPKLPTLVELKTSGVIRSNADTPQSAPLPITMETGLFPALAIRRFTTTDPLMKSK